jgi:hypothetical protein
MRKVLRFSSVSVTSMCWTVSIHLKQKSAFCLMLGMLWMAEKAFSRSARSGM